MRLKDSVENKRVITARLKAKNLAYIRAEYAKVPGWPYEKAYFIWTSRSHANRFGGNARGWRRKLDKRSHAAARQCLKANLGKLFKNIDEISEQEIIPIISKNRHDERIGIKNQYI